MSTKKTSLTGSTTASFESSYTQIEIDISIESVTLENQACDEVFFDVFVTKDAKYTLGTTGGIIQTVGKSDHAFEDFLSFNDANEQSFNKPGIIGKPTLKVMGNVQEVITKKDEKTGRESKGFISGSGIKFIFDEDTQKVFTSPKVYVFALLKATGTRRGTRYRWTGSEGSKHTVYALHEDTGRSATLEVNIENCDKGGGGGKLSNKDSNTLSLGVELTDFYVAAGGPAITVEKGAGYFAFGSFVVWPVPDFASLYAIYFNNADLQAFDWGDLPISKESMGKRDQVELIAFSNSESGSLQYAPLGNSVTLNVLGDMTGSFDNGRKPSLVGIKGPGEVVYRRSTKEYSYTDPITGKVIKGYVPSDEAIKVGPTELFCVDWTSSVIVKGTGKVVAKYSCPAKVYNFSVFAPVTEIFWTKWNCQATVGYQVNDAIFGPLAGNGGFSIPNPFEKLQAMWDKERQDRYNYLISKDYSPELIMKG